MKIIMTANEIYDRGIWEEVCDMKDISEWALNEGAIDGNHEIVFTKEESIKLGIINK
jgi:hypothetical protein